MNAQYDFEGKYTGTGRAGQALIDNFYRNLFALLDVIEPVEVHEAACGAGFSTQRIHAYLKDRLPDTGFSASDLETDLVEKARERVPSLSIESRDIFRLNDSTERPDLVIALEVFEHLETPEEALRSVLQLSRRWVIASVPREPVWRMLNMARGKYLSALGNTPGHLQHWSTRAFLGFVANHADIVAYRTPLPWTQVLLEKR